MGNIIKSFSDFHNPPNDRMNEGVMDFFGGLLSKAGGAVNDVIKGKITAYFLDFFGIKEGTFLSKVVQNVAEQIDWTEYKDLVFGQTIPVSKLAPKLSDATMESIIEIGLDPIAEKMGVDDTNGLIYKTIREMISNETKKKEFKDTLVLFWTWVLGGGSPKSPKKGALFQPSNKKSVKSILSFTPEEKKKIASDPAVKSAAKEQSLKVSDILKDLSGMTNSQGKGLVGGE